MALTGRHVKIRLFGGNRAQYNGKEGTVKGPAEKGHNWYVDVPDLQATVKIEFLNLQGLPPYPLVDTEALHEGPDTKTVLAQRKKGGLLFNTLDIDFPDYVYYFDEGNWRPEPDTDGKVRYWGLVACDPQRRFASENAEWLGRRANIPYGESGCPEQQIARRLADKRLREIRENRIARSRYFEKSYRLRITLDRVVPEVYREVQVSGGMSLGILADKVICPVMGWGRECHSHVYLDTRDGSVYGSSIENSNVDADIFYYMYGWEFVDDDRVRIGDILSGAGESLEFVYDLALRWDHTITVMGVSDPPDDEGAWHNVCLGGRGGCPPEDGSGLEDTGSGVLGSLYNPDTDSITIATLSTLRSANDMYNDAIAPGGVLYDERHPLYSRKHTDAVNSTGFAAQIRLTPAGRRRFDWTQFNLTEAAERVAEALMMHGPRDTCMCCIDVNMLRAQDEEDIKRVDLNAVCAVCGSYDSLKFCSACKSVAYCSAACQKKDWKEHKALCKASRSSSTIVAAASSSSSL